MDFAQSYRAWARERKEKAAARKAAKVAQELPPGAAPLLWCVLLTMVGVAALAGSTWMLLVFIVGSVGHFDWFSSYAAGNQGEGRFDWSFEMDVHWAVAIGIFLFCLAIAIFNATWLEARKHLHGVIRHVVTGIGICVALFMISGAIVVQQRGTDARAQDVAEAIQTAQIGAASAEARLQRAETRLREMRNHENQYMAVAATVGAAEFERSYLSDAQRARETPERLRLLERSLGAARQADALEAEIAALADQVAAARTTAVQTQVVTVRDDGFMAGVTAILEDARKPITATLGELLALTAFGFALAAWASRRTDRSVERSGWAPESHRIEDLRDEARPEAKPMEPMREEVFDAETGERMVKVKPREYWRRVGAKKGEPTRVSVQPDVPPDETGVAHDGGGRSGSVAAADEGAAAETPDVVTDDAQGGGGDDVAEEIDPSAEEAAAIVAALESAAAKEVADGDETNESETADAEHNENLGDHVELPENEGVMITENEAEGEQHDAHVRARGLIEAA